MILNLMKGFMKIKIKPVISKRCPRSGKMKILVSSKGWPALLLPLTGLVALI
jgi:hypothetical protein